MSAMPHANPVVVVMGVSGTGKTTLGAVLAERLGVPYAEADDFHSPGNIAKMASGRSLDDADRAPWLDAIGAWASTHTPPAGTGGTVTCSALKRAYRDRLRAAAPGLFFVHLTGDRQLITDRMTARQGHFMPAALLDSQFATLEPLQDDEAGAAIDIAADPDTVVRRCLDAVRRYRSGR
ncbi:gluconokinase [Streptomyces sp. GC420]|uniref:gluconokinase n=1 Tax=Streptomyces sp. GC420 TaxID=2697568 RepID=UPI0014151134|nr:gluconokinase [Streptomyces sp. GC420]NBM16189.1 gluconokinase [Streptomyces sp. GC420]